MLGILSAILLAGAVVLLIPTLTLAAQLFASFLPARSGAGHSVTTSDRLPLAVVVPAHNEERGVGRTIASIRSQLKPHDRLVVVADNCSDRTEHVARDSGADVIVRNDTARIGKGYALAAGFDHLAQTGLPPLVVFVDSDCVLQPNALDRLSGEAHRTGCPVQGLYLMRSPANSGAQGKIAEVAWRVRNHFRPLGLSRLGLGCPLMGSGMAIPSERLLSVTLGNGHIVEDTVLGVEFARQGYAPRFCESAVITSEFPASRSGLAAQRSRWIHGNLEVMLNYAPALIGSSLRRMDPRALALGFDLLIPPLTVLLFVNTLALTCMAAWMLVSGDRNPFLVSFSGFSLLVAALALIWVFRVRKTVALGDFRQLPGFFRMILDIILNFGTGKRSGWTRSDRS